MSITTPIFILITIMLAQTSEVLRCSFGRTGGGESPPACLKFSWTVIGLAATGSLISLISHFIPAGTLASSIAGLSLMVIIDVLIIKIMFDFATKIFSWECPESGLKRLWCWSSKVITWMLIISVIGVLLYKIDSVQASIENSLLIDKSHSYDGDHRAESDLSYDIQPWSSILVLTHDERHYRDHLFDESWTSHDQSADRLWSNTPGRELSQPDVNHDVGWNQSSTSRASPVFRRDLVTTHLTTITDHHAYH